MGPPGHVLVPALLQWSDVSLLLLRLMVAGVFLSSGLHHVREPAKRAQSIGMSVGFTLVLGCGEIAGSIGVALGILTQLAAFGLILIMLGAIQKKIFVWKMGFWGDQGWHYDLMLTVMNLVIMCTGGGKLVLF